GKARKLQSESKPTICSIIRILRCRATPKARSPWEEMETPFFKMLQVISPETSAEYSPRWALVVRFNSTRVSRSNLSAESAIACPPSAGRRTKIPFIGAGCRWKPRSFAVRLVTPSSQDREWPGDFHQKIVLYRTHLVQEAPGHRGS